MGLQALRIVEEEISRFRTRTIDPLSRHPLDDELGGQIDTLEARIKDRIMRECVEVPAPPDHGPDTDIPF